MKEKSVELLRDVAKSTVAGINFSISSYGSERVIEFLNIVLKAHPTQRKGNELARKIVVSDEGNSGSVGMFLVRRCTHLGYSIWFLQDAGCPALSKEDITVFISGTGTTSGVVNQARIARKIGATVILLTSKERETVKVSTKSIQSYANLVIEVGGKTKEQKEQQIPDFGSRQIAGAFARNVKTPDGILVLGAQFEINALVFLLGVCHVLMILLGETEDSLRKRHRNLE